MSPVPRALASTGGSMPMRKPRPDLRRIRQAIEDTSGYPYELDIARRIESCRDYTYLVEPNYSFEDQDTGQARELDFRALEAVPISTKNSEYAFVVILGSCKANRNPYVFFTRQVPLSGITLNSDVPIAGCPLEIVDGKGGSEAIEWYFQLHKFLHIAEMDSVSSQFCEVVWKNGRWEIRSEAIFRDTIIPLIKAMAKEIDAYNRRSAAPGDRLSPDYQIFYPLLVVKGPLLEYYLPAKGPARLREARQILLIRHYESKTVKCRYAIDVVHDSYLHQYLDLVQREVAGFVNRVRHRKRDVLRSIKHMAEQDQSRS